MAQRIKSGTVAPTVLRSYHEASKFADNENGVHGFFLQDASTKLFRWSSVAELLILQGFSAQASFSIAAFATRNNMHGAAIEAAGNAIPPVFAFLSFLIIEFVLNANYDPLLHLISYLHNHQVFF